MDRQAFAYALAWMDGVFGSDTAPAAAQNFSYRRYSRIATAPLRQRGIRTCAVGQSRGAKDRLLAGARYA